MIFKKDNWNDISFTVFKWQSLRLVFLNSCCICAVYTLFALAEYGTILSNIAFHWVCSWHFNGSTLLVAFSEDTPSKTS